MLFQVVGRAESHQGTTKRVNLFSVAISANNTKEVDDSAQELVRQKGWMNMVLLNLILPQQMTSGDYFISYQLLESKDLDEFDKGKTVCVMHNHANQAVGFNLSQGYLAMTLNFPSELSKERYINLLERLIKEQQLPNGWDCIITSVVKL